MSRRHADPLRHRGPRGGEALFLVTAGTLAVVLALAVSIGYPLLVWRP
jgi:hypothetical protein